jgi:hypothetical protein
MRPIWRMIAASVGSWLAIAAVSRGALTADVGFGMLGPLVAAVGTWLLVDRTFRTQPLRLGPVMIQAFLVKMLFFGVYVILMLRVLSLTPLPFVLSFTAYYLALHATEAVLLHRLMARARTS